jgi:hypothetical protein
MMKNERVDRRVQRTRQLLLDDQVFDDKFYLSHKVG